MGKNLINILSCIFGFILIIASIVLFIFVGVPSIHMLKGDKITAEVIENVPEHSENGTVYHYIYGYEYNGEHYEVESDFSSSVYEKEGKEVALLIDPEKPSEAKAVSSVKMLAVLPFILFMLGLAILSLWIGSIVAKIKGVEDDNAALFKVSSVKFLGKCLIGEGAFFIILYTIIFGFNIFMVGFSWLFIIIGAVLIVNENKIYRGKPITEKIESQEFISQQDMIDNIVNKINEGNNAYIASSEGGYIIKIGIKWRDGLYLNSLMSVQKASCNFEHIVKLHENNKTYEGMDLINNSITDISLGKLKLSMNMRAGVVHSKIYIMALGIDKTTGEKGLIKSSLDTDELRNILDGYVESYGYRRI